MVLRRRTVAIGATIAVLGTLVAGAIAAGSGPSDAVALQPARDKPDKGIEKKVDDLVQQMTLQEKLHAAAARRGLAGHGRPRPRKGVGGVFSLTDPTLIDKFQHMAVEQSRLHIPILFAFDTIHGYRTVFPIKLATAGGFDPSAAADTRSRRASPRRGIKRRTARWWTLPARRAGGASPRAAARTALGAAMAGRRVGASQGEDYSAPDKLSQPQALRRLRPARGRARLQHDGHVRPAAAKTSTCRRSRLRSKRAPTPRLLFNAISGVPARQRLHGARHPQGATAVSTASWSVTTPPSTSCELPAATRTGPAGNGADAAPSGGAERRHRLRDGEHEHPRQRPSSCWPTTGSRWRRIDDAVRADPARQVPRGPLRASRTSTRPRPRTRTAS